MGSRRLLFLLLCIVGIVVIIPMTGCCYGKMMDDKVKCTIKAEDVTEVIYGDKVYRITEEKVDREQLGNFIASIAKYMVYDMVNLTEIEQEEYAKIDWDGGDNGRYAVRVYGNVYHIKDTEDKLGVEVNGVYYIAVKVKE